jgi:hypothetical protein
MSPEQTRGKTVDRRADIWAFGCLLYEMLTGRQTFEGESVSDTLAAILKTEPDWTALPAATPRRLVALIRRCLRKDPTLRLRDAGDARIELDEVIAGAPDLEPTATPAASARRPRLIWLAAAGLLAIALLAAGWTLGRMSRHDVERTSIRFMVTAPPETRLPDQTDAFVISPDGKALAFVAVDSSGSRGLWIRELTSLAARPLPGTDNASGPFWSPDSRSIAFFADGKLKKVALAGGSRRCCAMHLIRAAAAGARGERSLRPGRDGSLFSVSAAGGSVKEVLGPDFERHETSVRFRASSRRQALPVRAAAASRRKVSKCTSATSSRSSAGRSRERAPFRVAAPGYLILVQNDLLQAQKFDVEAHRLSGEPVPLGDAPIVLGYDGGPAVSVSDNGVLVRSSAILANTRMLWLDRSGRTRARFHFPPDAGRTCRSHPTDSVQPSSAASPRARLTCGWSTSRAVWPAGSRRRSAPAGCCGPRTAADYSTSSTPTDRKICTSEASTAAARSCSTAPRSHSRTLVNGRRTAASSPSRPPIRRPVGMPGFCRSKVSVSRSPCCTARRMKEVRGFLPISAGSSASRTGRAQRSVRATLSGPGAQAADDDSPFVQSSCTGRPTSGSCRCSGEVGVRARA